MNLLSILLQAMPQNNDATGLIVGLLMIILIIVLIYFSSKRKTKEYNEKKLRKMQELNKEKIEREQSEKLEIEEKLQKAEQLKNQIIEIQKTDVVEILEYKKIIIDNEKVIIKKGGDNQLQLFLKVNSFLLDFRERILNDQAGLNDILDIDVLKSRIIEESKRNRLEKLNENLSDIVAEMEGRKQTGFDSTVDKLFRLGEFMKPVLDNQIKTLEYYHSISTAMIVFYLNEKKIRYFEIHEAFEKLGVFDSTWQKNTLNKLDKIELRLAQISNQLTDLNRNFISLVESSEKIVSELKEINDGIMTNNLLQSITAYQTWRVNNNTKSLIN